jgi:hypothetical protein
MEFFMLAKLTSHVAYASGDNNEKNQNAVIIDLIHSA